MSLSSGYWHFILKKTCIGTGRKNLKMSDFDRRHLNAISELTLRNCFLWIGGDWLFPLPLLLHSVSTCHSHLFSKWRKSVQQIEWLTRVEVDAVSVTLSFLSKAELFFLPFHLGWNLELSQMPHNLHSECLKVIELWVDDWIFRGRPGRGWEFHLGTAFVH